MKDYAQNTYNALEQRRFNNVADIALAVVGAAAIVYLAWLFGCGIFNVIIFNF